MPSPSSSRYPEDSPIDYSHSADPIHGTSTITVATFNLVATIVGGGVLSLPFAFQKCGGCLYGILLMLLAALATDKSCQWLCWGARIKEGGGADSGDNNNNTDMPQALMLSSYGQVGKAAFGPAMEVAVSLLLFIFLFFVLIAYMVLVKDIWTPLILNVIVSPQASSEKSAVERDNQWGPYVLLFIILAMTPFLVQRSLHALRFNCYIGFASVSILCVALCHHAVAQEGKYENYTILTRDFWLQPPESWNDVIVAFPIIMLSYLCHFNVNQIQKALINPTPRRVHTVIHRAMAACGALMTTLGVGGYAYVLGSSPGSGIVQGNILLNCEDQQLLGNVDPFLLLGRMGCGITIMLGMAMLLLPCRDSAIEVLDVLVAKYRLHSKTETYRSSAPNEESPLVASVECNNAETLGSSLDDSHIVHFSATCLIVVACYTVAIRVPGVATVWSLCGSSMAFTIAFTLPASCFLQLARKTDAKVSSVSKMMACLVLALSILAAVVCTAQTVQSLRHRRF